MPEMLALVAKQNHARKRLGRRWKRWRKRVWKDACPSQEELEPSLWPLTKGALYLHAAMLLVCPFFWRIDRREPKPPGKWDARRVRWVLVWLGVLAFMWAINPAGLLVYACAFFALWRLIEIFTTGLGTALNRPQQARARDLETIAIYALQMTFIFAIFDRTLTAGAFQPMPTGQLDYLWLSWTDMTTIGNTYEAQSALARILEMLTTTSGLLLVGVLLAFGINKVEGSIKGE